MACCWGYYPNYDPDFIKGDGDGTVNIRSVGEAAKKILFLVAGPIRGGWGLNVCASKEKYFFLNKEKMSYSR